MGIPRRLIVTLVMLLAAGTACGGETTKESTAARRAVDDGGVEVTNAGEEPRRALRLTVEQGQKFSTRMTMSMQMKMQIDGKPAPATPLPAMQVLIDSTVDDVAANGDISFSYVYSAMDALPTEGVDAATVEAVRRGTSQVSGLKGTGVMTPTGAARSGSVDTSGLTDPTLKTTLDSLSSQVQNLTVPFPAEDVGKGATWQVSRSATLSGIQTNVVMRYRLAEISKDSFRLEVEQDVTAPPGPVTLPNVPPGTSVNIVDYTMRSTGSLSGTFDRLFPRDSTLDGSGDITMRVVSGAQSGNMVQHIDLDVSMKDA